MQPDLTEVRIAFNEDAIFLLNLCLALIMFGIALNLDFKDFKALFRKPRAALTGLSSQYIVLPLLTLFLVFLFQPHPYLALGMFLVAACPGGNVSNYFSFLSKGNVPLSIALSMFSSLAAVLFTPIQFSFWPQFYPETAGLLKDVQIDFFKMAGIVLFIMGIPLIAGILFRRFFQTITQRIKKPIQWLSFVILIAFVTAALYSNFDVFKAHYHRVILIVFVHNGLALLISFFYARILKNDFEIQKTVSIETAIQNTGLGLVLIFSFFNGNGAMAILAAWWGIWHLFSGFLVSQLFAYLTKRKGVGVIL